MADMMSTVDSAQLLHWLLPPCVFVMMACIGLELEPPQFLTLWRKPRPLIVGLLAQSIWVPLLGFGIALLYRDQSDLALGIVLVVAVPGGAIANAIVFMARARPDVSVSLSVIMGLLSLVTTPLLIWLGFGLLQNEAARVELPVLPTIARIFLVAVLPILLGMALRHRAAATAAHLQAIGRRLAMLMLVAILALVFSVTAARLGDYWREALQAAVLLCTAMLISVALLARLARLDRALAFTLAVETSLHNVPLVVLIADRALNLPQLAGFAVIYAPVIAILTLGWAVRFRRNRLNG